MIYFIDGTDPNSPFPDVEEGDPEMNGLIAVGGDLTPQRLVNAYSHGIFPWYTLWEPIKWWSPDPRLVLFPDKLHISHSLHKTLRRGVLQATFDLAFPKVIRACAGTRRSGSGTWLTNDMIRAYEKLHKLSIAHSVDVWEQDNLVGGLYGVALGRIFFGESMFSLRSDASKVALVYLAQHLQTWEYQVIDCQMRTEHLVRMGAEEIPRKELTSLLDTWVTIPGHEGNWYGSV